MSIYIDTVGDVSNLFGFYPSRITYFDKNQNIEETIYKDGIDYNEIEKWLEENDGMEVDEFECAYIDGDIAFVFELSGNLYGYDEEDENVEIH